MGNGFNAAEELDPLFSVEDREPRDLDGMEEAESHSFDPEHDPLASFLEQMEAAPSEGRGKDQALTESNSFLASFLTELIDRKSTRLNSSHT